MKNRPTIALTGTAAGTSLIIDTSGYNEMYLYAVGTTGSCTSKVYANSGTSFWSGTTLSQQSVFLGSSVIAAASAMSNVCGLSDQAIVTQSDITGTYVTSYVLHN